MHTRIWLNKKHSFNIQILSIHLFLLLLPFKAVAESRVRLEEGTRARQTRVAVGDSHTCAVIDDGTVRCWGKNTEGQLGDGTRTLRTSPVPVTGLSSVVSIAAGRTHTCALRATGLISCWGSNDKGELGDGTTDGSLVAVTIPGLEKMVQIAAGFEASCGLRADGSVFCWGKRGVYTGSLTVPTVAATNAIAISVGGDHACALIIGGTVKCWGASNAFGELGNGNITSNMSTSNQVTNLSNVVAIAAGVNHTCALLADGREQCWGSNFRGQLGNMTATDVSASPLTVVTSANGRALAGIVAISAGFQHSCAILSTGELRCWGDNSSGELGEGTTTARTFPVTPVQGLTSALEVSTGPFRTCAMEVVNSNVRCWGDNSGAAGLLGNASTVQFSTLPVNVVRGGSIGGRTLRSGNSFNCSGRGDSRISCWGLGSAGQLGIGTLASTTAAADVQVSIKNVTASTTGGFHACAVLGSGAASCWGQGDAGQLGSGDTPANRASAVAVVGLTDAVQITAGLEFSCALRANGTVSCWGGNNRGQLGAGDTPLTRPTAAPVTGVAGAVQVAAGAEHACAVTVNGTVFCWGTNLRGQLGDGTAGSHISTPQQVVGLTDIVAISAGGEHTCALAATGQVRCWGNNASGRLGNGDTSNRTVPDTVFGLNDAVAITAGGAHTCAVRAEGSAVCWGSNSTLQLGTAASVDTNVPSAVIQSFTSVQGVSVPNRMAFVSSVLAGNNGTCALQAFGQPRCWGLNANGQIGDGTKTDRARPTVVNSFTANVDPEASLDPENEGVATVTALINCQDDGRAFVILTLQQPGVGFGFAIQVVTCSGGMQEFPISVRALTEFGFQAGDALAVVQAIFVNPDGTIEDQNWTRAVVINQ